MMDIIISGCFPKIIYPELNFLKKLFQFNLNINYILKKVSFTFIICNIPNQHILGSFLNNLSNNIS